MSRNPNPKLLIKITNRGVERIAVPERGYVIAWDERLKGFGCRVMAPDKRGKVVRSFIVNYRITGKERRISLGRYGVLSADQARDMAGDWLRDARKGIDPAKVREAKEKRLLFSELAERYITEYAETEKSVSAAKEDTRRLRKVLIPLWGKRPAEEIGQFDIVKFRNRIKKEIGHHTANRYVALLSKMFNLAVEWGVREDNPARRRKDFKPFPEEARDRWLRPDEIRRMFESLALESDPIIRGALAFLLLTGARRGEALSAKWDDIDFDAAMWRIPKTKSGKPQTIPISGQAMSVLQSLPRVDGCPWVFPGRAKDKPLTNLTRSWYKIRERAGLTDCRIHDLRRSLGSMMVQAGASLYVTQRALRHADSRVTSEVYGHLGDGPLRSAFEAVGEKVAALMRQPGP